MAPSRIAVRGQGVTTTPRDVALHVGLRPGLGHRRHRAPRQPPAPAHLVPGRVVDGDPRQRHLGPAAVAATRARLLLLRCQKRAPISGTARQCGGARSAMAGWEERFDDYVERLGDTLGHADRRGPLRAYATGLLLPGER